MAQSHAPVRAPETRMDTGFTAISARFPFGHGGLLVWLTNARKYCLNGGQGRAEQARAGRGA